MPSITSNDLDTLAYQASVMQAEYDALQTWGRMLWIKDEPGVQETGVQPNLLEWPDFAPCAIPPILP